MDWGSAKCNNPIKGHSADDCRCSRGVTCHKCGLVGHFASVCRTKNPQAKGDKPMLIYHVDVNSTMKLLAGTLSRQDFDSDSDEIYTDEYAFQVLTDHKPLVHIWQKPNPPLRIARWGLRLQPLSTGPGTTIQQGRKDGWGLCELHLSNIRIVIPASLQARVVQLAHEGHQGESKTKALTRSKVWFSGIDAAVHRSCSALHTMPSKHIQTQGRATQHVRPPTWTLA